MRAHEFITENKITGLLPDVARALPCTYSISGLPNSDFYKQYRFGVAMASSKGAKQRAADDVIEPSNGTVWGENLVVSSSMDPDVGQDIDTALRTMGLHGKKLISTMKSEETTDVGKTSPVSSFRGYNYRKKK